MKNLILALSLVSLNAFATIPTGDVRLEFNRARLRNVLSSSHELSVKVDSRGLAYAEKENSDQQIFLGHFNREEMREIDGLIGEASVDELLMDPASICEAIPNRSVLYSANNGNLVLSTETAPCGGSGRRDGDAAEQLIQILDNLVEQVPAANMLLAEVNG